MKPLSLTPEQLREQIALVLKAAAPGQCVEPEAVDELFEKFHIYHQELEYQNQELQRISAALEQAQQHLKDLYENAPVAYLTFDENFQILSANRAFRDLLAIGPGEALPKPWNSVLAPQSQDAFYFHHKALREHGAAAPCHVQVVRHGTTLTLKLESNLQKSTPPLEYRSTLTDLTRETQAETALRRSEARFKEVIENATDGILLIDRGGRILVWNGRMEEITGLPGSQCLGRLLWEVQYEVATDAEKTPGAQERQQAFLLGYLKRLEQGAAPETAERLIQRQDGTQRWVGATVFPLRAEGETLYGCIFRDLTEDRRLHQELAQAKKVEAIGLLAGGIAHDFNNLLGVIFGRLELAKMRPGLSPELSRDLEKIETAARHSAEMTKQLLTYARRQPVKAQALDLNQAIRDLLPLLQTMAGEGIDIRLSLVSDLPPVFLDPSQLEQVVTNLTANARDAMGHQGVLVLGTSYDDQKRVVSFFMEDTGCGMDPGTLGRLFEPFFTTKKLGHGTGLGLATVQGIVYQNHGEIHVLSQVGKGSRFVIDLPAHRTSSSPPAEAVPPTPEGPKSRLRILVVDDEPGILEFVADSLRRWGHTVWEASSAEAALARLPLPEGTLDLLVTDVIMPGKNGKELADLVQARVPGLRVLFMSGFSGDHISESGMLTGAAHFLQKPFDLAQLRACIDALSRA